MDEDTRNPVEVLAEEFVDQCRRGESPSIEEYVARHPEQAEELETVLQAALLVEQLKQGSGWPASPEAEARDHMPKLERLGDYRIVREVGRGGMGVVYEAEQEALRRRVAVKVLAPMAMRSSGLVTRFRREAQAAANLHHTNIVQVYGVGEQDGLHYFVMQFVDGRGLDELATEAEGGVKPRRAANIMWQVASALAHAHERGVLHRDVKPANLLLDAEGTAWITDFGLAKVLLDPGGLTEAGDIIGTVRYMPPERFEGTSDARGDVYGLGLVLYELLAGRAAFSDKDRGSLISAVREGRARPLRDLVPEVPADLATIVGKAIAANPDDRYQTAAEVADDLECYLEDRPILARPIGPIERTRRWCRRNKTLAVLASVAAAAVLLAAVTGWVGYLVAQGALDRESEGRVRAEVATKRAETNERMSLDALEDIFDSLAGSQEGPPRQGPGLPPDPRNQENAALLQSVLAFYDRFAAENQTNPRLRRESARALVRVGTMRAQAGDGEAATKAYARAVASFEAMRAEFPDDDENVIDLARTLSESALWAVHDERPDDAERDAERAVAELQALGDAHDGTGRRGELARARCRLAYAQASRGDEALARAALAQVAADMGTHAQGVGRPVDVHLEMALVYKALAAHAAQSMQHTQALADLDAALTTLRDGGNRPPPPQAVADIQRERVVLLRLLGRTEEADQAETEAQSEGPRGPRHSGGPGQGRPPRGGR